MLNLSKCIILRRFRFNSSCSLWSTISCTDSRIDFTLCPLKSKINLEADSMDVGFFMHLVLFDPLWKSQVYVMSQDHQNNHIHSCWRKDAANKTQHQRNGFLLSCMCTAKSKRKGEYTYFQSKPLSHWQHWVSKEYSNHAYQIYFLLLKYLLSH